MAWAWSIAPLQSDDHHGCAHSVSTLLNPASLPPTLIVTYDVAPVSVPSWFWSTDDVVAPEQAWNDSVAPTRAASITG